jgi:hypothetical protein
MPPLYGAEAVARVRASARICLPDGFAAGNAIRYVPADRDRATDRAELPRSVPSLSCGQDMPNAVSAPGYTLVAMIDA